MRTLPIPNSLNPDQNEEPPPNSLNPDQNEEPPPNSLNPDQNDEPPPNSLNPDQNEEPPVRPVLLKSRQQSKFRKFWKDWIVAIIAIVYFSSIKPTADVYSHYYTQRRYSHNPNYRPNVLNLNLLGSACHSAESLLPGVPR